MKVITFNVNSIRVRMPAVLECIEKHRPDVLCLQETKVQDHQFPAMDFQDIGHNVIYKGEKSYNGVAVITPHQIENHYFGFDEEPADQARLVRAQIKGVNVVNAYVPQGKFVESSQYQYKLMWFERLRKLLDSHFKPSDKLLWLGDLNVAPTEIDLWNPKRNTEHVCFHEDVRKAMQNVVQWGFVDLFRQFCDQGDQYSFWDYRQRSSVEKNRGWRIDHIMATKPLANACRACYIDKEPRLKERPSDHAPVIAEFDI